MGSATAGPRVAAPASCAARTTTRAQEGQRRQNRRHRDRRHRGNRRRCLLCQQPVRRFRRDGHRSQRHRLHAGKAEDALKNAGFNVEYGKAVNDDEVEEGRVVDQTPDGNRGGARGLHGHADALQGPRPRQGDRGP
ncbi:MAG: PASTA domain-containing protein [Collinsella intestinalis]